MPQHLEAEEKCTVEAVRRLRERLRKEILRWEDQGTARHSKVDKLSRLMATYPMRARVKKGNGKEF
jgi:hypothetical protein